MVLSSEGDTYWVEQMMQRKSFTAAFAKTVASYDKLSKGKKVAGDAYVKQKQETRAKATQAGVASVKQKLANAG